MLKHTLFEIDEERNIIQELEFISQEETGTYLIITFTNNTDFVNFAKFKVDIDNKHIELFDASYDDYEIYQPIERGYKLDLDNIIMNSEFIICYYKKLNFN